MATEEVILSRLAVKDGRLIQPDGMGPDFSCTGSAAPKAAHFIHRCSAESETYFIANRTKTPVDLNASFRITDKIPELGNAVTGERHDAAIYSQSSSATRPPSALRLRIRSALACRRFSGSLIGIAFPLLADSRRAIKGAVSCCRLVVNAGGCL